jgi:hypothetical protein
MGILTDFRCRLVQPTINTSGLDHLSQMGGDDETDQHVCAALARSYDRMLRVLLQL